VGIAIGRAGGFIVNFGTDAHYIESAGACRDGLMAALLAQKDMTGNPDMEKWLQDLCAGLEIVTGKVIEGLGASPWRVHQIWVKKYPCCFLTHRHVDMMLDTLTEHKISYDEIDNVEIHVGPVDYTCNRPRPKDTEDARFSFHHIMAALMLDGDVDSDHFSNERLNDPRFQEAWTKVSVTNHPEWPTEFMSGVARIKVSLRNGENIVKERVQARGGPDLPLSKEEFSKLYSKYTRNVMIEKDIVETWEMLTDLENLENPNILLEKLIFIKRSATGT
jgi:2-methylcitrate dehydratase PrpD